MCGASKMGVLFVNMADLQKIFEKSDTILTFCPYLIGNFRIRTE